MRKTFCPIPGFDEDAYLRRNPEVADYLRTAPLSAWEHFVTHGYANGRSGGPTHLPPEMRALLDDADPLPLPPEHLRKRVHGAEVASFRVIGRLIAANLASVMGESGIRLPRDARILDFGCGSGRVLSMFRYLCPEARFQGTDIDEEAIAWCREHLSRIAGFAVNPERPPMDHEDQAFDLVFSVSVFTHLPEVLHLAWLRELRRVTRKGGYLLLSVHGPELMPDHVAAGHRKLAAQGFLYGDGTGTEGLPRFYRAAYHTADYIRREWGQFFDIVAIIPRAVAGRQDMVVCRRPTAFQEALRKLVPKKLANRR